MTPGVGTREEAHIIVAGRRNIWLQVDASMVVTTSDGIANLRYIYFVMIKTVKSASLILLMKYST